MSDNINTYHTTGHGAQQIFNSGSAHGVQKIDNREKEKCPECDNEIVVIPYVDEYWGFKQRRVEKTCRECGWESDTTA